ncbi:RNA polymerase I associated factor, A49-like protein [Nadsonia fulvescens var. elongata DSM 6958]|uniref:RNA polymerase I associated factor, A49-like protein n=1 Tax=Nadsonia fulvescens var. elongata DSM 6958 TaxID=857566 RepID=A0A1E3PIK2_9ASCO|nr:RNA polymerase I associated factor, A49-like protein [Nadsonia fulvescens var. elongata DSM 6958]
MAAEKRKRDDTVSSLKVTSYNHENSVAAVSFGGITVPESATFTTYKPKSGTDVVLHGESARIDYDGVSTTENGQGDYCVGVYDPVKKTLELFQTPLIAAKSSVRAKKSSGPAIKQANVRNIIQRQALGEAFGTKKAKKAITDLERNRIESDKLDDLEMAIVDTVKSSTSSLPTQSQISEQTEQDRPIPPYNLEATEATDIYPISSLIPEKIAPFIRVQSILHEEDLAKRTEMLPHKNSQYISDRLANITNESHIEKLKLLYYLSFLMGIYENKRLSNKATLILKLGNPAESLVDYALDVFATAKAGNFGRSKDKSFAIDPKHENKLLCHIIAIALHIDIFMLEIPPLAKELSLKPSKLVELCRAMGCNVKSCNKTQGQAIGLSNSELLAYKIATLKAPLKLPELTKRARR